MTAGPKTGGRASAAGTEALQALSEAIESGAGLPAAARAAAQALGASVALIDRSSSVLAVADASSGEEERLLAGGENVERVELRVAEEPVGELRFRPRGKDAQADASLLRIVSTLLALEVQRARSPEWESDRLAADFVAELLERAVTDPGGIVARAGELGCDVERGVGAAIVRARPLVAQTGEWRERVMELTLRALRAGAPGALATARDLDSTHGGEGAEVAAVIPAAHEGVLARSVGALQREVADSLAGFHVTVAYSRRSDDPAGIHRAGKEALLAVNVGEAEGRELVAFEETGAYRLLLPAMSEDASELERFYEETVAPLAAYDEQYETELVRSVETFLDNDGNVTQTAEELFTHRHTVRYRLERVKELSGHDLASTEGREKLSLGLKAMRVLGIAAPRGPALEPGAEAGRVRRRKKEG